MSDIMFDVKVKKVGHHKQNVSHYQRNSVFFIHRCEYRGEVDMFTQGNVRVTQAVLRIDNSGWSVNSSALFGVRSRNEVHVVSKETSCIIYH